MFKSNPEVVLEKNSRFSQSILWELQREYFNKKGINAWVGQVPFYITSNPFLAKQYAEITLHFIREYIRKNNHNHEEPFYIIELGTGSGKFSFHVLQKIKQIKYQFGLQNTKIIYLMTDFTSSNLSFWEQQPQLSEFTKEGLLDFAVFDLENDKEIKLKISGKTLSAKSLNNPCIVFANYIFDTISHDAFYVHQGTIQEALIKTTTNKDNMENKTPKEMEKLQTQFTYYGIKQKYYNNELWNQVLWQYKNKLQKSTFLLPTGAFNCLDNLKSWSPNGLLLLCSDKGYNHLEELENLNNPRVIFHGSFSMMVNFHAIGKYFELSGGSSFLPSRRRGIKSSAFMHNLSLQNFPETEYILQNTFEGFSLSDFFNFHTLIKEHKNLDCFEIHILLSHMHLTNWDPHIFRILSEKIKEKIVSADANVQAGFKKGLEKIAEKCYHMPGLPLPFAEIAILYETLQCYHEAIKYYNIILDKHPESEEIKQKIIECNAKING